MDRRLDGECEDDPNWRDDYGRNCAEAMAKGLCKKGGEWGPGWDATYFWRWKEPFCCFCRQRVPETTSLEARLLEIKNSNLTDWVLRERLDLSVQGLNGMIPSWIDEAKGLKYLDLSGNYITGVLPESLTNLTDLEYIDLSGNQIYGPVFQGPFWQLRNLKHLDLSHNWFNVPLDPLLFSLPLEYFDISNNRGMPGPLPPEVGNAVYLRVLRLAVNTNMQYSIPPEIGHLRNLEHLDLTANTISGTLPSEVGNLTTLKVLRIGNCNAGRLGGDVPQAVANFTNLEEINIALNFFTGPLVVPDAPNLWVYSGNSNFFEGSIPRQMWKLPRLKYLFLNYNQLGPSFEMQEVDAGQAGEETTRAFEFTFCQLV